jgi:microcin C transport system substrate-binding protein
MNRRPSRAPEAILAALLALVPAFAARAAAADGPRHGLSAFGDLKYPADFMHFAWVNRGIVHSWWYDPGEAARLKSN